MSELGRILIAVGLLMAIAGLVLLLAGRLGIPLGHLPGDFAWRGRNVRVYFPLGTSILISIVLSLVLYLLSHWRR